MKRIIAIAYTVFVAVLCTQAFAGTNQPHLQPPKLDGNNVVAIGKLPPSQAGTTVLYENGNTVLGSQSVEFGGKLIVSVPCTPSVNTTAYSDTLFYEADGTETIHHAADLLCTV